MRSRVIYLLISLIFFNVSFAFSHSVSNGTITSATLLEKSYAHFAQYSHTKPIGLCFWLRCVLMKCSVHHTLELDEYLPDLVVSVYNNEGQNPWFEARIFDKGAYAIGNIGVKRATGVSMGDGNMKAQNSGMHATSIRTKSVDVIGNPFVALSGSLARLQFDTNAFFPYYQSNLDLLGRLGAAEALRYESALPTHVIGKSFANHWGFEFPRNMQVSVNNDYKASVIAALHALDIVTNKNTLHTVYSTGNSCGQFNCKVSNVIEEQGDKHAIWEEVYPLDRIIQPGKDDKLNPHSLGAKDNTKGQGNYVFLIWRHYRGCIQLKGTMYLWSTVDVDHTIKR